MNLRTLSISQAVAETGISRDTLYLLCESGQLQANRPTPRGRWRISETSLQAWIQKSQPAAALATNSSQSFVEKFPEMAGQERMFG